jgi:hypothetical protein
MVFSVVMRRLLASSLAIIVFLPSAIQAQENKLSGQEIFRKLPTEQTLVVGDPRDSYNALAVEISNAESIPSLGSIQEALTQNPHYVIWVGSPGYFTDKVLAQCGWLLKSTRSGVNIGIITGRTIEDARALWLRGPRVKAERSTAVRGEKPLSEFFPVKTLRSHTYESSGLLLNKEELIDELRVSDYLTFTGKGSGSEWQLADGTLWSASNLPKLSSDVLATADCAAWRLEPSSSMALSAVTQGAAAYAGFFLHPMEGFLPGEDGGLPLRYTWPEATIGDVIRLQNQSAMQAFAAVPLYFLLGDPRISLQTEPPCTAIKIETNRGMRSYDYGEQPSGVIPVRIKNGAQYHYAEIPGITSISDYDLFYNSRLQAINEGADKILLVSHNGGDLIVSLQPEPPAFWRVKQTILDGLDYSLLYLPGSSGPYLSLSLSIMALLGIVYLMKKRGIPGRVLFLSMLVGMIMGLSHALYASNRISLAAIISKPIQVGVIDVIATALLAGCGLILLIEIKGVAVKIAGAVIAVLPALGSGITNGLHILALNTFRSKPALGFGIYNYRTAGLALIGALCEAAVFLLIAGFLYRAWKRRSRQ